MPGVASRYPNVRIEILPALIPQMYARCFMITALLLFFPGVHLSGMSPGMLDIDPSRGLDCQSGPDGAGKTRLQRRRYRTLGISRIRTRSGKEQNHYWRATG